MAEHANAELIRRGYAAFGSGDVAVLDSLFTNDVVWEVAGRSPLAGTYTGKADVFGKFFAGLGERSGGSLSIEIETVVADDDHVVVLSHHTGAHGGRTLDVRNIDYYVLRDGQVSEARSTGFDVYGTDAFYA
jgi:ketosteroid isomerase-like protein